MSRIIVNASKKGLNLNLREILHYKDLFFSLAGRDFKVRYAQTFLGMLWAVIQPLATLLIFILIFHKVVQVNTGNIPYPVFAIAGMTAWSYFSFVFTNSGTSVIGEAGMIKKIYFPRLILPLSKALVGLIDFGITFFFVIVIMIIFGFSPSANIVWLPFFILFTIIAALGTGIWLSALTIRYRDFQHVIPFMLQIGMYVTPTAYPTELIVKHLLPWEVCVFYINPMAGIVEGFRYSILGAPMSGYYFIISLSFALLLFLSSVLYFKKAERIMADIL